MVKKLHFILAASFIVFQGCATAGELIDEIKRVRKESNSTRLDVSSIVRRHIETDSSWLVILHRLVKDGFECRARSPEKPNINLTIYDCEVDLRNWYQLGFGDKIRLDISIQNGRVATSGGELVYLSL